MAKSAWLRRARVTLLAPALVFFACSQGEGEERGHDGNEQVSTRAEPAEIGGTTCTKDFDCAGAGGTGISPYCAEGVCCNQKCTAPCMSCRAANKADGSKDGSCGPRKQGALPQAGLGCPEDGTACGPDGRCDGKGSCNGLAPQGKVCGSQFCVANVFVQPKCNGAGSCALTYDDCGAGTCQVFGCTVGCQSSDACASGVCQGGNCVPIKSNGGECKLGGECGSGHCSGGICCDAACDGPCVSCIGSETGGPEGFCMPVKAGQDPGGDCAPEPDCGLDGACDGNGACRLRANGTPCGAGTACSAGVVSGQLCDGLGTCAGGTTAPCDPYAGCKDASQCADSCSAVGDCAAGFFCAADQTCQPLADSGSACASGAECKSGTCVDGVCCKTACSGQCETCNLPGSEGACVAFVGTPSAGKTPCAATPTCAVPRCDGVTRDSCEGCPTSACDGDGTAVIGPAGVKPCKGYRCVAGDCLEACSAVEDCAEGYACNAQGRCAPPPAPAKDDDGGCAVGAPSPRGSMPPWLGLLLALGLVARRRRVTR